MFDTRHSPKTLQVISQATSQGFWIVTGKPFEVNKIEIRGKNLATERSFLLFAHHLMMEFRAVGIELRGYPGVQGLNCSLIVKGQLVSNCPFGN